MAALLAAVVLLLCVGAGVGAWLLVRPSGPQQPMISAFSNGRLTRVGPYLYCSALNLDDCQTPQAQGELRVNEHYPVQLSVPEAISHAPWRLLRCMTTPPTRPPPVRPDSQLAVTIPTLDPQRGTGHRGRRAVTHPGGRRPTNQRHRHGPRGAARGMVCAPSHLLDGQRRLVAWILVPWAQQVDAGSSVSCRRAPCRHGNPGLAIQRHRGAGRGRRHAGIDCGTIS